LNKRGPRWQSLNMPESTLDILEYLYLQQERFATIIEKLLAMDSRFAWSIALQHSFLTYEVSVLETRDQRFARYYYWKRDMSDGTEPASTYCTDEEQLLQTREQFHPVSYEYFRSVNTSLHELFSQEVMNSVKTAEAIAQPAYGCMSGDDYAPGVFSKVALSEKGIHLEQINHYNARSLAHKENYSLRNLKFFVPTGADEVRTTYGSEKIGNMLVEFDDRSSANNRECGRLINAKIIEARSQSQR
jgi:hypothetical protein